jgi:hypothetical protein
MTIDENRRPIPVTLLAWSVLILTMFNAVRFGTTLAQWELIQSLMERPGPIYIAVTGLFWALGWLMVFFSLWLGKKRAGKVTLSITIVYCAYYWFDRLVYQTEIARENLVFSLSVSIFFLISTAIILHLPGSRNYFQTKRVK